MTSYSADAPSLADSVSLGAVETTAEKPSRLREALGKKKLIKIKKGQLALPRE